MKRITTLMIGMALVSLSARYASGADNASVDVVMTIQSVSVARTGVSSLSVSATAGSSKVTERTIFKNDGNGAETFAIKITSTTGSWTPVTTTPGANQYRLSALWHQWDIQPSTAEFQTNDALTTSNQTSSDSVFFNDSETHTTTDVKGYNVAADGERNIFFKFEAPSSGTGSSTAHVTVTASAS